MKKVLSLVLSLVLCTAVFQLPVQASPASAAPTTEIVYQDEDITVEVTTTEYTPAIQTYSAKSKSATSVYYIKNSSDEVLASFSLKASFTYTGSSSTCTSASYSTSTPNMWWGFSSASASRSGNTATGSFRASCILTGNVISDTISLTCSKSGSISV